MHVHTHKHTNAHQWMQGSSGDDEEKSDSEETEEEEEAAGEVYSNFLCATFHLSLCYVRIYT
jgi:hypothetical protein